MLDPIPYIDPFFGNGAIDLEKYLPRPRHVEVQLSEAFQQRKRDIWGAVEEEVRAAMQRTERG